MGFNTIDSWKQFGASSLRDIAEAENDFGKKAYAWLYNRLTDTEKASLPQPKTDCAEVPPPQYVPVLQVQDGKGILGFLFVGMKPTYGSPNPQGQCDDYRKYAYEAAKIVFDLFSKLNPEVGEPEVGLELHEGEGTSLSLPAMIAAMGRILGVDFPDDIVSTGCLNNSDKKLEPVSPGTLSSKIEVAKRFGYKKLVLVKGQEKDVPNDCGIEKAFVDPDPLLALFDLLELAKGKEHDQRVAQLLAVYAHRDQRASLDVVKQTVARFCESTSRLVRHVTFDILSRAAMHAGETKESEEYRKQSVKLDSHEYPINWLGHYLRYEQMASCAVLAVDSGIWNDDAPAHREVNLRVKHLQSAIDNHIADINDCFAAFALKNTRAQRQQYNARLKRNLTLLESAWTDFISFYNNWRILWEHANLIGRTKDSNFKRQRNYCLGVLADAFGFLGELPSWEKVGDFLQMLGEQDFVISDAFDLAAQIHWWKIGGRQPSNKEIESLLSKSDMWYDSRKGYPNFLPYELLLRYGFGDAEQQCHALKQLEQAAHLEPKETSILSLLALRTRAVLALVFALRGQILGFAPVLLGFAPVLPPEGTELRKIADDLLRQPDTLIARCPY